MVLSALGVLHVGCDEMMLCGGYYIHTHTLCSFIVRPILIYHVLGFWKLCKCNFMLHTFYARNGFYDENCSGGKNNSNDREKKRKELNGKTIFVS